MSRNPSRETIFRFKQFSVANSRSAMKVGTDGVLVGAWATAANPKSILDVGAGTGLVALMAAQRYPEAVVTAIEIDETAFLEASENFKASPWGERISAINADFIRWSQESSDRFDLIISNPPFFKTGIRSNDVQRAAARHCDTLDPAEVVRYSRRLLNDGGRLAMIIPADMSDNMIYEAALNRLYPLRKCDVVSASGKPALRTLMEFSTDDCRCESSTLIIRGDDGYTEEYRRLTTDFYLQF